MKEEPMQEELELEQGDRPSFCKAIGKASICVPRWFREQHGRELGHTVTFECDNGCTWKVSYMTDRFSKSTFERFMRDVGVEEGELLIFELVARSRLRVRAFDRDGSEKELTRLESVADSEDDNSSG